MKRYAVYLALVALFFGTMSGHALSLVGKTLSAAECAEPISHRVWLGVLVIILLPSIGAFASGYYFAKDE